MEGAFPKCNPHVSSSLQYPIYDELNYFVRHTSTYLLLQAPSSQSPRPHNQATHPSMEWHVSQCLQSRMWPLKLVIILLFQMSLKIHWHLWCSFDLHCHCCQFFPELIWWQILRDSMTPFSIFLMTSRNKQRSVNFKHGGIGMILPQSFFIPIGSTIDILQPDIPKQFSSSMFHL